MELGFGDRLKHAWNTFKDPFRSYGNMGYSSSFRPDRPRLTRGNEKSIVTALYNRIALDVAAIGIEHVRLDAEERFTGTIYSKLNNCLTLEANIDQTGYAFIQDVVMSMLDEGCVAIVPVDTKINPHRSNSYEIETLRTGKIVEWYPKHVKVNVYNDREGRREDVLLPKSLVGIVENPFYSVINEPNSTMQRLIRKLALLDMTDDQNASGKLDLIVQLPYVIKSKGREEQAERRRKDIEMQLTGSRYGIAYTDGAEKITQLNRPVENNLMSQIEYLTSMLYSQLGMTKEILDGTASKDAMNNYYNRTIKPFLVAITSEMKRKFLTKTARSQMQSIMYFKDPFELVSTDQFAEMGDKFTRNEIMTSNELRQLLGLKPSSDPRADELRNKNLNAPTPEGSDYPEEDEAYYEDDYYDEE